MLIRLDQSEKKGGRVPFLSDPAGRVITQEELDFPALIIADRWGEIWAAWLVGASHQFPSEQDILQWLVFIHTPRKTPFLRDGDESGVPCVEWGGVASIMFD